MNSQILIRSHKDRRSFIGGSDARIIMGSDESALIRLWREKRGEVEPEDLSSNLIDMAERLSTGRDAVVVQTGAGGSGVTSEAPPTPSALPAAGPPR